MLCSCGSKRSYCEYGVEICKGCGKRVEAGSELLEVPWRVILNPSHIVRNPYFFGYSFQEAQGYKRYGIIQKY